MASDGTQHPRRRVQDDGGSLLRSSHVSPVLMEHDFFDVAVFTTAEAQLRIDDLVEELIARTGVPLQSRLPGGLYLQAAVFNPHIQCEVRREPVASCVARELSGLQRDLLL